MSTPQLQLVATEEPGESIAILDEALQLISTKLAELHSQRQSLLKRLAAAPRETTQSIREVDATIEDMRREQVALQEALEAAEAAEAEQKAKARLVAAEATRKNIGPNAQAMVAPAANLDKLAAQYIKALRTLKTTSEACADSVKATLATQCGDDLEGLTDSLIISLPRATAASTDAAVAMAHFIRDIVETLDCPALGAYVQISHYVPKQHTSMEAAIRSDAAILAKRFGGAA